MLTAACVLWLGAAPFTVGLHASPGKEQAEQAALQFGRALQDAQTSLLKPILPHRGKVRVHFVCLGPEEGSFSASQVEALLQNFLKRGAVLSFDLLRVDIDEERYALTHGRARVMDREGHPSEVYLHLTFEPEEGRWVVREIREDRP